MTAGHNALRADQVPVKRPHSKMQWHKWVILIAGSTALHYVLFAIPTFTSRQSLTRSGQRFLRSSVTKEPGTLQFEILLPKDDDTKVFLYEMCPDDWSIAAIG
jgi:hypothetical protein